MKNRCRVKESIPHYAVECSRTPKNDRKPKHGSPLGPELRFITLNSLPENRITRGKTKDFETLFENKGHIGGYYF